MWNLTFDTRFPIGFGPRSLSWANTALPSRDEFLALVGLEPASYWFTLHARGGTSAPMDWVPVLVSSPFSR
jgi:hypothetical protein